MRSARGIGRILATGTLAAACCCPTAKALDPSRSMTQYRLDVWTREQGLPQNTVESIAQTPDGYLWVGTQQGLARFDGVLFTVFRARDTEGLPDDMISTLLADRQGTLWIGTDKGLSSRRDGRFTAYPDEQTRDGVGALFEDREGTIWVAARNAQLGTVLDGRVQPFADADGAVLENVSGLAQDRAGRLCVAALRIYCLEQGRFRLHDVSALTPRNRAVHSLALDGDGDLWAGTLGDGLIVERDGGFHGQASGPAATGATIFRLLVDRHGVLWGGTYTSGLIRRRNDRFEALGKDRGLPDNSVKAIFEDREGSLWIGTGGGGLVRLTDRKFTPYSVAEGLSNPFVHSVIEDRSGALWVGTAGGLNRIVDGAVTRFGRSDGLPDGSVLSLWETRDGAIWVGTQDGAFRYREGRFAAYPSPGVTAAVYQDAAGDIWAGSLNGLSRLVEGRFVPVEREADYRLVSSIAGDRKGNLWFAAFRKGLVRYVDGTSTVYGVGQGLADNRVLGIYVDDDVVWFATYAGGLHRLEGDAVTVYSMDDGLPCQNLFWIVEDDSGRLWVTCNDGVFSVSKRQLNEIARDGNGTIDAVLYGTGDGMRSSDCNGGQQPAGWKAADGKLWFPTSDGIVSIDPRHLRTNELPPPVVVERVVVDDVEHEATSAAFPPGRGRLEFDYTATSLLAPEKIVFRYRLEGFDREWVEAGHRRTAFYTNIPPGRYVFRVRAANNDGVWNEAGASFGFRLRPHFYQTVWFYAIAFAALTLAVYAAHRYRLSRVVELERIRTRIATDLHDDIGASLSQIAILSEVLQQGKQRTDAQLEGTLSRIADSSRELVGSMSDIVWAVNPKRDRLRDVVQRMRRFASDTLAARDIELSFRAPGRETELRLGADVRRQLYLVFKESLNNAVRHSRCRGVEVDLQRQPRRLVLTVRDDGVGFDPHAEYDGHGLTSVRRRAADLGGRLEVDSTRGRGTTVRLEIPLGKRSLPV